jgi:hypothetical protein
MNVVHVENAGTQSTKEKYPKKRRRGITGKGVYLGRGNKAGWGVANSIVGK